MRVLPVCTRASFRISLVSSFLLLAACGSSNNSDSVATTSTVGTTLPVSSTAPTTVPAITTVSVNSATAEELTAAFEAVGVPNAASWAGEVVEYRPYDPTDVQFVKLRTELDKYGISEETFALIISVLNPS